MGQRRNLKHFFNFQLNKTDNITDYNFGDADTAVLREIYSFKCLH